VLPAEGGGATRSHGDAMMDDSDAASGDATMGHQRCYHGPSTLLPWVIGSATMESNDATMSHRSYYHIPPDLLPWDMGGATMDHRMCYHRPKALLQAILLHQ
jgi:hypothetical protein